MCEVRKLKGAFWKAEKALQTFNACEVHNTLSYAFPISCALEKGSIKGSLRSVQPI